MASAGVMPSSGVGAATVLCPRYSDPCIVYAFLHGLAQLRWVAPDWLLESRRQSGLTFRGACVVDAIARSVILACPAIPWSGSVWRTHGRRFAAIDPGGALILSGRYHRGRDLLPPRDAFPALNTSAGPEIATWE